jgi:coenzyme F420-reducing hydrogenase alpha subunit
VTEPIRLLRRLLYCGEWIQSHALHVYLLHAPDFLGYESAIHLAQDAPAAVERGLQLKKAGNELMRVVGGREVHPINVRVGGFYRSPMPAEFAPVREALERAREAALETVRWTASFDFPDYDADWELVALRQPGDYPLERGRIVSDRGLDIDASEFDEHVVEEQVPHSTALHAHLRERGRYLVGPLARYALDRDELSPLALEAADDAGLGAVCHNPFRSIVVRSVEIVYACDEALRLLDAYEPPEPSAVRVEPRAGVGQAVTEAPRGLLHHRYELDAEGTIVDAKIVPPTSQNQDAIEDDLRGVVAANQELDDEALGLRCEQTIRNYDPCISCATHFLALDVERA